MRSPLLPKIALSFAHTAVKRAKLIPKTAIMKCVVLGGSTSAVRDIGGASIRLRTPEMADGGYLLAIRATPEGSWLPAIAGVPGRRYDEIGEESRLGLAELMILARPIECQGSTEEVTFLPTEVLQCLYPTQSSVEVVKLKRVTDFHLDLTLTLTLIGGEIEAGD